MQEQAAPVKTHESFDQKLAEQDQIMQEEVVAIDEGALQEENDLFDDQGNFDELTAKIRATGMF